MKVDYIDSMGSDLTVVDAARVSFDKKSSWADVCEKCGATDVCPQADCGYQPVQKLRARDAKLIKYLADHNHWTPMAHPQVMLRMTAPIFVARQAFKHKVGFVENEISRRYVADTPEMFMPTKWRTAPENAKQGSGDGEITELYFAYDHTDYNGETYKVEAVEGINAAVQSLYDRALNMYETMIKNGVAPEQARMVLPQAMYTSWFWTASLAAWARFYMLRSDPHAQSEIQDLAAMVGPIIQPLFPVSWEALTKEKE